jgi:hypothetical protein
MPLIPGPLSLKGVSFLQMCLRSSHNGNSWSLDERQLIAEMSLLEINPKVREAVTKIERLARMSGLGRRKVAPSTA